MSALRDFLLAPAPAVLPAARAPAGTHAAVAVIAPASLLACVSCAAGLVLARRARGARPLVGLYTGTEPVVRPSRVPRDALSASLDARGVAAQRRGRVLVAELPGEPDAAARAAAAVLAVAAPAVLGVSLRVAALDDVLVTCDAVLVVTAGGDGIAELARASARALGRATAVVDGPAGPVARALAAAGLAAPAGIRRAMAEVLA